jgi:alkyl hydroperoxide reductase subunit AhpC
MFHVFKFTEEFSDVLCPANWKRGDDWMISTTEGVAKYLFEHANN